MRDHPDPPLLLVHAGLEPHPLEKPLSSCLPTQCVLGHSAKFHIASPGECCPLPIGQGGSVPPVACASLFPEPPLGAPEWGHEWLHFYPCMQVK